MTIRVSREAEPQLELYGAHTAEVLGGAEGTISSLTFTPTSDTLILVHKNAVSEVQLEVGDTPTDYQIVGPNLFDVTETGIQDVPYAKFDLVDDKLDATITDGLTGQAFVAGDGGCYVSDVVIAAAGTFSIGGTTHNWTGAAPGILKAVTNNTGRVMDTMLREGDFTEAEIANLELFYRAQGGKGLLVPSGTELFVSPTLEGAVTDAGGGSYDYNWTSGATASLVVANSLTIGETYVVQFTISNYTSGAIAVSLQAFANGGSFNANGTYSTTSLVTSGDDIRLDRSGSTGSFTVSNISVQRLTLREEL